MHGALVGYGMIAAGHHEAYLRMDDLTIVAVVDACHERRAVAKRRDPRLSVYASMSELFDHETIEFIDLCTPPSQHLEQMLQALDGGCHVLCEKPFLLNQGGFNDVIERIGVTSTFVYPSHNYKFSPVMRHLVETVRSSDFGHLVRGFFRTMRSGHARGVPEWEPDWRRMPEHSGGGILQDHATHSIYLACHLCNCRPVSVSCTLGNLRDDCFRATEDTALMRLDFPGGIEIRLDLTWASDFRHTSYAILGSRQNIIVENDDVILTESGRIAKQKIVSDLDDPSHKGWFPDMLRDFMSSIGNSEKQKLLLAEAWTTCATIRAAYASARCGGCQAHVDPLPAELHSEKVSA